MRSRNFATINKTITGIATAQQVGDIFPLSHIGALNLRIDLVGTFHAASGGSIAFVLQTSPDNINWVATGATLGTASMTTGTDATWKILRINAVTDAAVLPLAHVGRIVVTTTHASDTVSLTGIIVQE